MSNNFVISLFILFFGVILIAGVAGADTLSWELPTERENGTAITPAEIQAVEIYRDGVLVQTLIGSATSYDIGDTCTERSWSAAVIDTGDLRSDRSASLVQQIDTDGCRPKPPTLIEIIIAAVRDFFRWFV
jgi:hypothetical protein